MVNKVMSIVAEPGPAVALHMGSAGRSSNDTRAISVWKLLLLLGMVAIVYSQVVAKLVMDWWRIPDFSHGFLVVPFAAYLAWRKRAELRQTPPSPTWAGIAVMGVAASLMLLGVYGAELFLMRLSLLVMLVGVILLHGRAYVGHLRFTLLVLLLAIPIPAIVFNQITMPLQMIASKAASAALPLFGVPTLREGNIIQVPMMKLEVAQACSGIRSLMSLITLAILYGYFAENSALRRTLLVVLSVPIAITANAARIVGTGICVQYWSPDMASGFFHEFSGWLVFVVSLLCLFAVHRLIRLPKFAGGKP
jgi:exosortase